MYILLFSLSFPLVACPPGQYQSSTIEILTGPLLHAYQTCLPCSVGTYQPNEGQVECVQCEAGTYQDSIGSHTCKTCSHGHYQPKKGQTGCIPCEPGSYQSDTGGTTCIPCTVGRYQPNRGQPYCIECPNGYTTSNMNSTQCVIKGEKEFCVCKNYRCAVQIEQVKRYQYPLLYHFKVSVYCVSSLSR